MLLCTVFVTSAQALVLETCVFIATRNNAYGVLWFMCDVVLFKCSMSLSSIYTVLKLNMLPPATY